KPTMLSKGTPPTTLAPEGTEALDMPEGYAPTGDPLKKTQLPKGAQLPTMLAKAPGKTTLDEPGTTPMDLPGDASKKKTMLPARGDKTGPAPEGGAAMELPEGYGESPKKTPLPPMKQKTVLDEPGAAPLDIPGGRKKPQLPPSARHTVLNAPEEADPMALP